MKLLTTKVELTLRQRTEKLIEKSIGNKAIFDEIRQKLEITNNEIDMQMTEIAQEVEELEIFMKSLKAESDNNAKIAETFDEFF